MLFEDLAFLKTVFVRIESTKVTIRLLWRNRDPWTWTPSGERGGLWSLYGIVNCKWVVRTIQVRTLSSWRFRYWIERFTEDQGLSDSPTRTGSHWPYTQTFTVWSTDAEKTLPLDIANAVTDPWWRSRAWVQSIFSILHTRRHLSADAENTLM